MDKDYFFNRLYPLQDRVLAAIHSLQTGFYLTGGTASSRAYLQHRFSEDLDLFVNDQNDFGLWSDRIIHKLSTQWKTQVMLREIRFVRLSLVDAEVLMKIELVNDVPSHIGPIVSHAVFGRLDSAENILANKISAAVDRHEPKDLADIWGFCSRMGMSLKDAITGAQSKASGIFPPDLARILDSASRQDWQLVRWIDAPDCEQYIEDLQKLAEKLLMP